MLTALHSPRAPGSPFVQVHLYHPIRFQHHPHLHNGHGAYRPVLNYNEISIHRKKIASKKIICCLLSAGTTIIIIGLILLLLGLYVINRQCPFHWHSIEDRCLYVSNHATHTWASARALCLEQGARMTDIENERENVKIKERLPGDTWIGLYRDRKKSTFQWMSGVPLSYTNWNQTSFTIAPLFTECVKIDRSEGLWAVESSCSIRMYAACEYYKSYYPFVLIGPVVVACGIIVMVLSIEVCKRLQQTSRKGKGLLAHEEAPNVDEKPAKLPAEIHHANSPPMKKPKLNQTVPVIQTSTPKSRPSSKISVKESSSNNSITSVQKYPTVEVVSPGSSLNRKDILSTTRMMTPTVEEHSSSQEMLELMLSPKSLT